MKFAIFSIISTLLIAVSAAGNSWYVPAKDITCAGHDDGHIECQQGHIDNAPVVPLDHPDSNTTPAIKGREANPLQKRVTCNIDGVTQGLACFTHCFAIGYCNSNCDSKNICHCSCMDKTPWWNPIVCSKTSCA
ncbi:uncharacterized protein E0L32_010575 [Thyridium curvatum]|uniref:Uncharacterized protein n=1 Tax=Thyridium curvatum TaxID=1093900 RepID=A0A507AK69_9PEZI|nr:uncharacterized protein E0L32_010575 [Thyridium curvatum]TPX07783.1 hypothetical protein E0L32_010575 [Thyridium curvatum]